jgi:hypothetical protein
MTEMTTPPCLRRRIYDTYILIAWSGVCGSICTIRLAWCFGLIWLGMGLGLGIGGDPS